jgi:hypothetical protein
VPHTCHSPRVSTVSSGNSRIKRSFYQRVRQSCSCSFWSPTFQAGHVRPIIGTVIAGVAIQTAFMDQSFLRKIRAIDRNPVTYLSPFLFTAVIAIFAMVGIIILSTLSAKSPAALLGTISGLAGFFSIWAIISLLYCLTTLVQFMGLKVDALDVPDNPAEIEAARQGLRQAERPSGQPGNGR